MWISEAINETIQEHGQAANVVETQGTCNPWLSELRLEGTTMSRLHARPQFQHVIRPGINFTMGIPLKGGSEIKGAAVARRADMEQFGRSILARGIGRMRAVTMEDQDNAKQACLVCEIRGFFA